MIRHPPRPCPARSPQRAASPNPAPGRTLLPSPARRPRPARSRRGQNPPCQRISRPLRQSLLPARNPLWSRGCHQRYILHKVNAPNGYLLAEDVKFTVEDFGEAITVVMKERLKDHPGTPNTGDTDWPPVWAGGYTGGWRGAENHPAVWTGQFRQGQHDE